MPQFRRTADGWISLIGSAAQWIRVTALSITWAGCPEPGARRRSDRKLRRALAGVGTLLALSGARVGDPERLARVLSWRQSVQFNASGSPGGGRLPRPGLPAHDAKYRSTASPSASVGDARGLPSRVAPPGGNRPEPDLVGRREHTRSMTLRSSRTLPGQSWRESAASVSGASRFSGRPYSRARSRRNRVANNAMSSRRMRKGAVVILRTSICPRRGDLSPTGSAAALAITRTSGWRDNQAAIAACSSTASESTSSSKTEPRSANANRPATPSDPNRTAAPAMPPRLAQPM